MKLSSGRQNIAIAVLLAMFCLPFLAVGGYLITKNQWAKSRIAELEPRYARLKGLDSNRTELGRMLGDSVATIAQYAYPRTQDVSQAGNEAQQRVRDIATRAGLSLVSSQVLPAKVDGPFDRIPLVVRLEGELPQLQAALVVISSQSPTLNFESFSIQTIGAVKSEVQQRLAIQLNLFVLRARS